MFAYNVNIHFDLENVMDIQINCHPWYKLNTEGNS